MKNDAALKTLFNKKLKKKKKLVTLRIVCGHGLDISILHISKRKETNPLFYLFNYLKISNEMLGGVGLAFYHSSFK